ncbi:MAG: AhpC/TSA family protein [Prolixibacteraceae bacterium]|nr:AhpC/TSA family protein [Prolixibacteraceae bacterium]
MKKANILFFIIAGLLALVSCNRSKEFIVSGKITHAEEKTIYLDELHISGSTLIDSAKIDKNGEFKLAGETGIPAFYLLYFDRQKIITLLIDSAEVVNVTADEVNFGMKYHVEGSPGSLLVKDLNDHLYTTKNKLDSISALNMIYRNRVNYTELKEQLDQSYQEIVEEQIDYSTEFVQKNPFSMASVLALYQKFDNDNYVITDLQPLKTVASALNSIYPQSEHVKSLYANTLELVKSEKAAKLKQFVEDQGTDTPDIVLPDANGNEKALSSLKGKYVLLQFWSAKDRGSRIINSTLVELYSEFRNKGFEIYQVSIDDDREAWLEAIKEDGLKWTNVGDMKGSNKAVALYNIQEIPYNYFLDKDGIIITKNLKGQDLYKTISGFLK